MEAGELERGVGERELARAFAEVERIATAQVEYAVEQVGVDALGVVGRVFFELDAADVEFAGRAYRVDGDCAFPRQGFTGFGDSGEGVGRLGVASGDEVLQGEAHRAQVGGEGTRSAGVAEGEGGAGDFQADDADGAGRLCGGGCRDGAGGIGRRGHEVSEVKGTVFGNGHALGKPVEGDLLEAPFTAEQRGAVESHKEAFPSGERLAVAVFNLQALDGDRQGEGVEAYPFDGNLTVEGDREVFDRLSANDRRQAEEGEQDQAGEHAEGDQCTAETAAQTDVGSGGGSGRGRGHGEVLK